MECFNKSKMAFTPIPDGDIRLDVSGCCYLGDIHRRLKETFGLPHCYGENWDALEDCLDDLFCGMTSRVVQIYGYTSLPKELQECCNTMLDIFEDIHKRYPDINFIIM